MDISLCRLLLFIVCLFNYVHCAPTSEERGTESLDVDAAEQERMAVRINRRAYDEQSSDGSLEVQTNPGIKFEGITRGMNRVIALVRAHNIDPEDESKRAAARTLYFELLVYCRDTLESSSDCLSNSQKKLDDIVNLPYQREFEKFFSADDNLFKARVKYLEQLSEKCPSMRSVIRGAMAMKVVQKYAKDGDRNRAIHLLLELTIYGVSKTAQLAELTGKKKRDYRKAVIRILEAPLDRVLNECYVKNAPLREQHSRLSAIAIPIIFEYESDYCLRILPGRILEALTRPESHDREDCKGSVSRLLWYQMGLFKFWSGRKQLPLLGLVKSVLYIVEANSEKPLLKPTILQFLELTEGIFSPDARETTILDADAYQYISSVLDRFKRLLETKLTMESHIFLEINYIWLLPLLKIVPRMLIGSRRKDDAALVTGAVESLLEIFGVLAKFHAVENRRNLAVIFAEEISRIAHELPPAEFKALHAEIKEVLPPAFEPPPPGYRKCAPPGNALH